MALLINGEFCLVGFLQNISLFFLGWYSSESVGPY